MNNAKQIAEKILNCKTYDIPDIQSVARAYLELEKECEGLKQHECMNCGAWLIQSDVLEKYANKMIDELKSEITKLKEENEKLKQKNENLFKLAEGKIHGNKL